jgi:hypothetical protein
MHPHAGRVAPSGVASKVPPVAIVLVLITDLSPGSGKEGSAYTGAPGEVVLMRTRRERAE